MRAVTVDPDKRTAQIRWSNGNLIEGGNHHRNQLQRWHGWTDSRGGYGLYYGAYGLAADNLLSAQVVTADGQPLQTLNADLFGDCGGGGNFELLFPPVSPASAHNRVIGFRSILWSKAVARFNEFIATAPDELTIRSDFFRHPMVRRCCFSHRLIVARSKWVSRRSHLCGFGTVLVDQMQSVSYHELIHSSDAFTQRSSLPPSNSVA